ncbi:hypothetical protein ES703_12811 [subsurface metagenome]
MSNLPQFKNTSQEPFTLYKFHPGTCTCSLIEVEPPTSFKTLRKPEIGEYEKRHIEQIKSRAGNLDPEILKSIIQAYKNNVLRSPVDDHPPPGPNAPKQWSEKREEHKEDTQRQEAKPGRMSIVKAEASKNGATDGYSTHDATKKKELKRGDPDFYTDWTGSRSEYPDEKETQHQEPKPREKEPGPKTKAKAEASKNGATDGYSTHDATKKKDLKRGDPGFYTDWTGSRSEYPDEKETQHQEPKPREKEPGPKTKAKLLNFPKYPTPPKEIWDWCKDHYPKGNGKRIVRALHKWHLYRERSEDKHYHGKSKRKNRQYVYGQQWLADKLGIPRSKIEKWFHIFEDDGIIYIPQRGRFDRGASLIELAYTEGHRRMNKQKTTQRKNPSSIR